MTKKELLEMEAFKALPDDAEIIFNTSKHHAKRVPLTTKHVWYEKRCVNIDEIQKEPWHIKNNIKPKYKCFFIIDAMPIDFMKKKLNITFDL